MFLLIIFSAELTTPKSINKNTKRRRNLIFLRRYIYVIKRVVENADPYFATGNYKFTGGRRDPPLLCGGVRAPRPTRTLLQHCRGNSRIAPMSYSKVNSLFLKSTVHFEPLAILFSSISSDNGSSIFC